MPTPEDGRSHAWWEDLYALAISSLLIALGANLLHSAQIATAGTVGLSLILSHVVDLPYAMLFLAINIPMFAFGLRALGPTFIAKSLAVTVTTCVLALLIPRWMTSLTISTGFAAVAGGTVAGMGALAAARHGAAAGGTLVIVLWLQRRFHVNAGFAQLGLDLIVVLVSIPVLGWGSVIGTACAILATDAIIMVWHRPQRRPLEP